MVRFFPILRSSSSPTDDPTSFHVYLSIMTTCVYTRKNLLKAYPAYMFYYIILCHDTYVFQRLTDRHKKIQSHTVMGIARFPIVLNTKNSMWSVWG